MDQEALTVAMTVAPGVYTRNRMFAFYKDPEVRRAKQRSAILRGVVRQLTGANGQPEDVTLSRGARGACMLRYRIASVRLARSLELSTLEAACVVYLGARAGVATLHPTAEDRALIEGALRRLASGLELSALDAGST